MSKETMNIIDKILQDDSVGAMNGIQDLISTKLGENEDYIELAKEMDKYSAMIPTKEETEETTGGDNEEETEEKE